jgi:hypothetical protein
MPLEEQTAWHPPRTLRAHRPPPPQHASSGTRQSGNGYRNVPARGTGHQAGIHPEDAPYHTTTQRQARTPAPLTVAYEEDDADDIYTERRMPVVVKKYNRQPVPAPTQVTEEPSQRRLTPLRFFSVAVGVLLLACVLAITLVAYLLPAYTRWSDDRTYGYPRTIHAAASVGHGTAQHPISYFTGENVRGAIYVWEIGEAAAAQATTHVYYIIQLSGQASDLTPVTAITFADMNGDGKLDMLVTLENGSTFVLYNTGSEFSQQNPVKK